jgi:aquaporin Z
MRRYATEFIGTFFLVFTISAVSLAQAPLAPLGIAAVLTAMIFAGGHISGAHYNPAVTVAVYLRGNHLAGREVLPYVIAQFLGATAAAGLSRLLPAVERPAPFATEHISAAVTVEVLATFALAYVVLNVATSRAHPNNSFYGLAIGFTVLASATAFGGISGGAFNPAVGIGTAIAGLTSWSMVWIYLIPTTMAGALAAVVFRMLNPTDMTQASELVDEEMAPTMDLVNVDEVARMGASRSSTTSRTVHTGEAASGLVDSRD